jgi:hypothetical protein
MDRAMQGPRPKVRRAISMTEVLAREDDVAKKTKVAAAVEALPGYGPAKAAAVPMPRR